MKKKVAKINGKDFKPIMKGGKVKKINGRDFKTVMKDSGFVKDTSIFKDVSVFKVDGKHHKSHSK